MGLARRLLGPSHLSYGAVDATGPPFGASLASGAVLAALDLVVLAEVARSPISHRLCEPGPFHFGKKADLPVLGQSRS